MPPARSGPSRSFKSGDFIVCYFPFREAPDDPGREEHISLCLGTMDGPQGQAAIVAAYTSSRPWPSDIPLPRGVRKINDAEALRMGQRRAFVIDARKIAFMPVTAEFFPHLDRSDRGVVGDNVWLATKVIEDLRVLARTPGTIVQVGPLRPGR